MIEDKSKLKNWKDNDVFAVKIENVSDEYDGRYLILIKKDYPYVPYTSNYLFFRAKITKDKKIPQTIEEINSSEYIITLNYTYVGRNLFGCSEVNQTEFLPDEFGYLNTYVLEIWFKRGADKNMFKYIGNFDLEFPKDEFIPNTAQIYWLPHTSKYNEMGFISELVRDYEWYNLRKHCCYTKEKVEELNQRDSYWSFLVDKAQNDPSYFDDIERKYNPGWGAGIYDSDMALDTKGDYQKFMRDAKKNNESHEEMLSDLISYYSEIIKDKFDGPIFWITLANEELKRKLLTKKIRDKALKSIKKDIVNWKEHELYEERKKVLNDLKEKLEKYKFE